MPPKETNEAEESESSRPTRIEGVLRRLVAFGVLYWLYSNCERDLCPPLVIKT